MMLISRLKSLPPYRWLFPPKPLFRDRKPPSETREVPRGRRVLVGGISLAGVVLLTWAALHEPPNSSSPEPGLIAAHEPAAASAGDAASIVRTTDGRAVADLHGDPAVGEHADTIATRIDPGCAEHAREKLMVGLTNYYLQRRLRPGASSDDAADTSSMTGLLVGPGDPAAITPDTACRT